MVAESDAFLEFIEIKLRCGCETFFQISFQLKKKSAGQVKFKCEKFKRLEWR
jgi:hypothetical protein